MKIRVQIAIMSHLSDAQILMHSKLERSTEQANKHINFAKLLLINYPDTSVEAENDTLNEIWNEIK